MMKCVDIGISFMRIIFFSKWTHICDTIAEYEIALMAFFSISSEGCDRSPARSWRMNDPLSIAGHERTQGWKIWLPGVKVGFQP